MQENEAGHLPYSIQKEKKEKNQLKVNQNLNIRAMIAKLLEENTGGCL